MAMSRAAQWLQQALLDQCSDSNAALQLDPEVVSSLVSYCEIASPSEAQQYLFSIVGEEQCKDIVSEYLRIRGDGGPSDVFTFHDREAEPQSEGGLHAYVKPKEDEIWSAGSKKTSKSVKQRTEAQGSAPPITQAAATKPAGSLSIKPSKAKGRKGGKGISLAEAAEGLALFPRGGPCTCQASRHKLINNCLGCGKIVCEQEGEGPCNFCGALVLKEGSDYAGLEGMSMPPANDAEAAAQAFKDRLVEFDRSAAQRTTVIDDQSDYFEIDGNAWLSDKEKQLLRQRQEVEERIEAERRKRVIVTIDLLGRKVVMEDKGDGNDNNHHENLILAGDSGTSGNSGGSDFRIKPNPFIDNNPVYVGPKGPTGVKTDKKLINHLQGMVLDRTGRVQHDDPVIEAVIGQQLGDIHIEGETPSSKGWVGPRVRGTGGSVDNDEAECMLDNPLSTSGSRNDDSRQGRNAGKKKHHVEAVNDSTTPKPFDICLGNIPRNDGKTAIILAPSLLDQKKAEAALPSIWSDTVLMPGVVLLKGWLSIDDQVEIVRECRSLGTGVGGFYQPTFGDGRHMRLQMMCLGKQHWEPTTSSYVPRRRNYDNASPPAIPSKFSDMVRRSLQRAQDLALKAGGHKLGRKQVEGELPNMEPTVCIVNFYEQSGALGMHQDKDESSASLKRGSPVVSFSVGDSAVFAYGNERDPEKAEKIALESGDVLVFGGPARMIYHGVASILPKSAPKELIEKSNLRQGRLNLTFREL
ncbi:hypothetical protein M758_10G151100 [Ceratodon purpureus]|nr:hypothetical protein M758_10G151100 [Ceratodon purpureus]